MFIKIIDRADAQEIVMPCEGYAKTNVKGTGDIQIELYGSPKSPLTINTDTFVGEVFALNDKGSTIDVIHRGTPTEKLTADAWGEAMRAKPQAAPSASAV